MDLYSFDIFYDNTRPRGERFYSVSNVIYHGGDISLLCENIEDLDYHKYCTHEIRDYIWNDGYVMYNKQKIRNSKTIRIRVGVNMDFEIIDVNSINTHILRMKELKLIVQSIIREEKINEIFS